MLLLAQASAAQVETYCGAGSEASLVCLMVARMTDSEVALRSAAVVGSGLRVVLIVIAAFVLSRLSRRMITRFSRTMQSRIHVRLERDEARGHLTVEKYRSRRFQRLNAITGVLRGVAGVVIWFVAIMMIIQGLGVSLQPVLAGAGLASVVIGFGAQQLVRDVLAGIAMLIEDQYGVGDWIEVEGVIGQVERVGLRATSFRDLDGVQHHVLNGHIQRVGNLSQEWSRSMLDIPMALDTDVPMAKAIIHKVATELAEDPVWGADIIGPPEIWGVQDFNPEGLSIRLVTPTKPMANWDINRQLRERLHHAFTLAEIRMPGKLREIGGRPTGPGVLTRVDRDPLASRGPRAVEAAADGAGASEIARKLDDVTGDPYEALADRTTELRIRRGREPRPD